MVGLLVVVMVGASACGSASSAGVRASATGPSAAAVAPANGVTIHTFMFGPATLDVTAGTTVTWANQDSILHTVTSGTPGHGDGLFGHNLNGAGSSYTFVFDSPGRYPYFCSIHNVMRGTIVVS